MLIKLGEARSVLLILLIYPLSLVIVKIVAFYEKKMAPLYYLFQFFSSHLIAFFPYVIIKKFSDTSKEEIEKDKGENDQKRIQSVTEMQFSNSIFDVKLKLNRNKKHSKIRHFLFIAFLYFSTYTYFYYYDYIFVLPLYGNISIVSEIIYFSIFEVLIMNKKLYRHHAFSMVIIILSITLLYIIINYKIILNN